MINPIGTNHIENSTTIPDKTKTSKRSKSNDVNVKAYQNLKNINGKT